MFRSIGLDEENVETVEDVYQNNNIPFNFQEIYDNATSEQTDLDIVEDSVNEASGVKMAGNDHKNKKTTYEFVKVEELDISEHFGNRKNPDLIPDVLLTTGINNSDDKSTSPPNTSDDESFPGPPVDVRSLKIPTSQTNGKRTSKKDFCLYCKKLITKLARHLQEKHKNEEKVKEFIYLPKMDAQRKQLINKIRREGNFLHNTDPKYNTGVLIICRQQQSKFERKADDYITCPFCQGFFSKKTIRIHYRKCNPNYKKGCRNIPKVERRMEGFIRKTANQTLSSTVNEESNLKLLGDDRKNMEVALEMIKIEESDTSENSENERDPDLIPDMFLTTSMDNSPDKSTSPSITSDDESFSSPPVDVRSLKIPTSETNGKRTSKRDFCLYCKKLIIKLARHLQETHKNEERVKEFTRLPKRNARRNLLINKIRREGNFLHNTDPKYNTGVLIICRQQQGKLKKNVDDYITCPSCRGFFSKNAIRVHYRKCNPNHRKGSRNLLQMGRRLEGFIHEVANNTLRRFIIPVMNDDDVTRLIKYDKLIMMMGNIFTQQYNLPHLHDRIRAKLRLLGRFKQALKHQIEDLDQLSSAFRPDRYTAAIEAIHECVLNEKKNHSFRVSTTASAIGSLLKVAINQWINECINRKDKAGRENAEKYLKLYLDDFPTTINKQVLEKKINQIRTNKTILPLNCDKDIFRAPVPIEYLRDVTDVSSLLLAALGIDEQDKVIDEFSDEEQSPSLRTMPQTRSRSISHNSTTDDDEDVGRILKKSKISTYKIVRRRWTEEEKDAVDQFFGEPKKIKQLPSLQKCREAIRKYSALRSRTPEQLKSWIDHHRKIK